MKASELIEILSESVLYGDFEIDEKGWNGLIVSRFAASREEYESRPKGEFVISVNFTGGYFNVREY